MFAEKYNDNPSLSEQVYGNTCYNITIILDCEYHYNVCAICNMHIRVDKINR